MTTIPFDQWPLHAVSENHRDTAKSQKNIENETINLPQAMEQDRGTENGKGVSEIEVLASDAFN